MPDWDPNDFTNKLIADMRAHDGVPSEGYFAGRRLLILTTKGAKSGAPRQAVLAYRPDGDGLAISASKGGAPTHPGWYHNLLASPEVTVEVNNQVFRAHARIEAQGPERDRLWKAHVEDMPGFGEYPKKTDRLIPMIVLERVAERVA
jgi:deazaflavin-dependent oxidoreductase (nitroreductase family)